MEVGNLTFNVIVQFISEFMHSYMINISEIKEKFTSSFGFLLTIGLTSEELTSKFCNGHTLHCNGKIIVLRVTEKVPDHVNPQDILYYVMAFPHKNLFLYQK